MAHRPTICLITPGHIASTPRLVKEADALIAAGYRVHVVAGNHYPPAEKLDDSVLGNAKWECTRVDLQAGFDSLARRTLRRIARPLAALGSKNLSLAARAHHAHAIHLGVVASRIHADLYIGHCLAGLPAAAYAAAKRRVRYGFDLEDFHAWETDTALTDPAERNATRLLCERLIPGCAHLTSASPLIADACLNAYGKKPTTVLNVFPLTEAPQSLPHLAPISENSPMRFYWFSQTIGEGRGLEAIVDVLGLMRTPVELQLRGQSSEIYRHALQARAGGAGLRAPIIFLPSAAPSEMARLASTAHLGLSVEDSTPPNRDICLTNKIFTYLLAGLPVVLTPTAAQTLLAKETGDAALLLDLGRNPKESAARLDALAEDPRRLQTARNHAWALSRKRFNWDHEQAQFLSSVSNALAP